MKNFVASDAKNRALSAAAGRWFSLCRPSADAVRVFAVVFGLLVLINSFSGLLFPLSILGTPSIGTTVG
jgi:hypothetical protein